MNIPVGRAVQKRVAFGETAPYERVGELLEKGFTGYVVAMVEGATGIEEALLLIRGREIAGAIFEAVRFSRLFYGAEGLKLALNLLRAEKGVFDVNALTQQQVDLIIAFNNKVQLRKPLGRQAFSKLLPPSHEAELVLQSLKGELPESESRESILKRFGLGSI